MSPADTSGIRHRSKAVTFAPQRVLTREPGSAALNQVRRAGTEGLTHTESQTAWLQGKAAFIPCGNWLENEMKGLIPDTFNMVCQPTPSLSADKVPFQGIQAGGGATVTPEGWR